MRPERNYNGIQFEELRRQIDPIFEVLHDELEEAYYGDRGADGRFDRATGWLAGVSKPWHGFDKRATPEKSKALFDALHGALFSAHLLHFHAENLKRAKPYASREYDEYDDEQPDGTTVVRRRVVEEREKLKALRREFGPGFDRALKALRDKGADINLDATD